MADIIGLEDLGMVRTRQKLGSLTEAFSDEIVSENMPAATADSFRDAKARERRLACLKLEQQRFLFDAGVVAVNQIKHRLDRWRTAPPQPNQQRLRR